MQDDEPDVPDLIHGLVCLLQGNAIDLEQGQRIVRDMIAETWPIMANIKALLAPSPSNELH